MTPDTFTAQEMREMADAIQADADTPRSCGCGAANCGWCQYTEQADKSAAMLRFAASREEARERALASFGHALADGECRCVLCEKDIDGIINLSFENEIRRDQAQKLAASQAERIEQLERDFASANERMRAEIQRAASLQQSLEHRTLTLGEAVRRAEAAERTLAEMREQQKRREACMCSDFHVHPACPHHGG